MTIKNKHRNELVKYLKTNKKVKVVFKEWVNNIQYAYELGTRKTLAKHKIMKYLKATYKITTVYNSYHHCF